MSGKRHLPMLDNKRVTSVSLWVSDGQFFVRVNRKVDSIHGKKVPCFSEFYKPTQASYLRVLRVLKKLKPRVEFSVPGDTFWLVWKNENRTFERVETSELQEVTQ